MKRWLWLWLVAAVAGSLVASGCRTVPPQATPDDEAKPKSRVAKSGSEKPSASKLASAHAHYAAAVVHDLNGETEQALQEFQRAAADDPNNETLILEVSRRFLLNKQPEQALEFLLAATARGNDSGEIYARLGSVYARLGRNEQALAANRKAVKNAPHFLIGYQNLFLNLLQSKQGEEALKLLDDAGKVAGADADFLISVADLYQNYVLQFPTQRDAVTVKALAVLTRAVALQPADPQTRLRLADGLHQLGDPKRAAEIYLPLLGHLEDLPMVQENVRAKLAEIYLRSDDRARARVQLEAIARNDPANPQVYYFLGSIAYDDKRWADAAEQLKKTVLLSPNFERAYYDLAAAQLAGDDAAGALHTMEQMRARFPQNFLGEYLSALAQARQKNYLEALKHYVSAEIIAKAGEPKRLTAEFYFEVGTAHERKGDLAEAEKCFERALVMKPEFPEAQNYLGYMWAERGEKLERARDLIEQALKAEPKSPAYLDSMGWVLFKLNQPKEALVYILKAVELNEEADATLYDHLGDIYAALDEPDKAREAWRKSLAVEDSEIVRKKLSPSGAP